MSVCLLDVNVLLAMADPRHVNHDAAHQWFAAGGNTAWATCPITENGFVRIASHPNYPNRPGDAALVLGTLGRMCSLPGHQFWAADTSLRDLLPADTILTHTQITDLYLLGLAVAHGGRLATFDQRIPTALVAGGATAIEQITP